MIKKNIRKMLIIITLLMFSFLIYKLIKVYAVFYSEANGTITKEQAQWEIFINNEDISSGIEKSFIINNVNYETSSKVANGKIAPGQKCNFNILINPGDTQVAVRYDVSIDASYLNNENIRIVSVKETDLDTKLIKTSENTYTGILSLDDILNGDTNTLNFIIQWDDFDENNDFDIEVGSKTSTISIPVVANITQYLGEDILGYEVDTLPNLASTKPYLPNSEYTILPGTDLSNGLVIEDKNKNQYVWIEVPKTKSIYISAGTEISEFTNDEYEKIESDLLTYTKTYRTRSGYSDVYYSDETTGLTSEKYYELKNKMLKSLYLNGGFWIGKYEVGDSISTKNKTGRSSNTGYSNTAVIKQNQIPYNFISCANSQIVANEFSPKESEHVASLMFGLQWDLILKHLEEKGTKVTELKCGDGIGSKYWGNYKDAKFTFKNDNAMYSVNSGTTWNEINEYTKELNTSVLLTTGAFESKNSRMNICDLAGNVCEWTLEFSGNTSNPVSNRGGYYGDNGSSTGPIASWVNQTNNKMVNNGFRITIY